MRPGPPGAYSVVNAMSDKNGESWLGAIVMLAYGALSWFFGLLFGSEDEPPKGDGQ